MPIKKTGRNPKRNTTTSGAPYGSAGRKKIAKKRKASAMTKAGVKAGSKKPRGRKSTTSTKTGMKRGSSLTGSRSKPTASKARKNQRKK